MALDSIGSASPVYVESTRLTDGHPTMHVHVEAASGRAGAGHFTRCGLPTEGMSKGPYEVKRLHAQGCPSCFYELHLVA